MPPAASSCSSSAVAPCAARRSRSCVLRLPGKSGAARVPPSALLPPLQTQNGWDTCTTATRTRGRWPMLSPKA
eukprot:2601315-Prymnesium_polylepis.1